MNKNVKLNGDYDSSTYKRPVYVKNSEKLRMLGLSKTPHPRDTHLPPLTQEGEGSMLENN
jgi:hypothetical protein